MKTNFRHDLSRNALVGHVDRMGDDGGPVVAVCFDDEAGDVRIGIRIRTLDQAKAGREAFEQAEKALVEELAAFEQEKYLGGPPIKAEDERRFGVPSRRAHLRLGSTNPGRRKSDMNADIADLFDGEDEKPDPYLGEECYLKQERQDTRVRPRLLPFVGRLLKRKD